MSEQTRQDARGMGEAMRRAEHSLEVAERFAKDIKDGGMAKKIGTLKEGAKQIAEETERKLGHKQG